ncbi:AEC family transporter [uncultured Fusobacterium sp.]|uniref:AEC family transporter n=1 Tax=uncultured Fusobacterium sp. TaxID=159267 RepID=UPI0025D8CA71|nr:AEC family transporter [uncultured Fusobacterium sp.]
MDISRILNLQCILFILIAIGTIASKRGIIKPENKGVLTDLLIYIFLPANIISSFNMKFNLEIFIKFLLVLHFACLAQVICLFYSKKLYNNVEERKKKVLQYATVCSNAAFLGLPIIESIYGVEGVMYASVAMIPQRIVIWSAGISCFTKAESPMKVFKRVALHPCIIAVYIGLIYMVLPIKFPIPIEYTIKTIGNCTLSVSMILIGTMLGEIDNLSSIFSWLLVKYTMIRLFLIPLSALVVCYIFGLDYMSTGIVVLLSGMPAGSTTAILAAKFDGDYIFASKVVVFSTVMSVISISIWSLFLPYLF